MTHQTVDIHQHITNQIVTAIEQGAGDFRLPWQGGGSLRRPSNISSGKAYRGINILALWATAFNQGYDSGLWGTFTQWANAGASVRKGEKATYIVFYKTYEALEGQADGPETRLVAKATPVFAAEQVAGYEVPGVMPCVIDPILAADNLVWASQAEITYYGNRACYVPATDAIHMPPASSFIGSHTSTPQEAFYATLLHELTHWTSHKDRCDRALGKRFGDKAYAMEELVAELGAAFLCADLGVTQEPRLDHAQYIALWLDVLKADKRAVFTAATAASKAVEYLTAKLRPDGGGDV